MKCIRATCDERARLLVQSLDSGSVYPFCPKHQIRWCENVAEEADKLVAVFHG